MANGFGFFNRPRVGLPGVPAPTTPLPAVPPLVPGPPAAPAGTPTTRDEFLEAIFQGIESARAGGRLTSNIFQRLTDVAGITAGNLQGFLPTGLPIGLASLGEILASGGQVSPELRNIQLADIARGTQQQQDAARAEFARAGLQQGNFAPALQAAIGQAGESQRARVLAQESREAAERQRRDVALLMALIDAGFQAAGLKLQKTAVKQGAPSGVGDVAALGQLGALIAQALSGGGAAAAAPAVITV